MAKNIRIQISAELDKTVRQKLQKELKEIEKKLELKFDTRQTTESLNKTKKTVQQTTQELTKMQHRIEKIVTGGSLIGKDTVQKTKTDANAIAMTYKQMFDSIERTQKNIQMTQTESLKKQKNAMTRNQQFNDWFIGDKTKNKFTSVTNQMYKDMFDKIEINQQKIREKNQKFYNNLFDANLSKKSAKESMQIIDNYYKDFEKRNQQFNDWFIGSKSKALPTEATSMFGYTKQDLKGINQQFESWFMPKMFSENIKSAKTSMKAFEDAFSKNQISTKMKVLNKEFYNASKNAYSFGNMMTMAGKKIAIWTLATTAIYAPIRALQQGLESLKEIDSLLVDVAKVTDMTVDELDRLAVKASEIGFQFGRTAQEYLQATAEFSRAGYGEQAQTLAELSLLLQNVGDVTEKTANEMLIAVDASYQLGGSQKELTRVIDMLNEVDKIAS